MLIVDVDYVLIAVFAIALLLAPLAADFRGNRK